MKKSVSKTELIGKKDNCRQISPEEACRIDGGFKLPGERLLIFLLQKIAPGGIL